MRIILSLLFAFIICINGFTQTDKLSVKTVNEKVEYLQDSIQKLNDKIDNLINKYPKIQQSLNQEKLNNQIEIANETIKGQNSLIDRFGTIFTWITVIFALLGITLTILVLVLGIIPARKAVNDLQKDLDSKIENYLKENRNKQINQALKNITSDNPELRNSAINYLSLTQHEGYSDDQSFKIYKILKTGKIDDTIRINLAYTFSHKKNEYGDEYFPEILKPETNSNLKFYAYRYFANAGLNNYVDIIRNYLISDSKKSDDFITLIVSCQQVSKEAIGILINDKSIIDVFKSEELQKIKTSLKNLIETWNLKELFNESYLMTK